MTARFQSGGDAADHSRHVDEGLNDIREALLSLRFGSVAVTVHEGRIVQIDVTEKKRLNSGK